MGKAEDRTNFLCECLADTYIKMLKTIPDKDIKIDDIVKLSGVGRNTYFRHFHSKNELLSFKMLCLIKRWGDEHPEINDEKHNVKKTISFFELYTQNKDFVKLLYEHKAEDIIFDGFTNYWVFNKVDKPDTIYEKIVGLYSLIGIIRTWVKRGMIESNEEMGRIATNLFRRIEEDDKNL